MKRIAASLLILLVGTCALLGDSYLKKWEPQVFTSEGAQFLLRLEVPVLRDEGFEVEATILQFIPRSSTYARTSTFSIKGSSVPQKILISSVGDRFVAINYNMDRKGLEEIVQVFDSRGILLKSFMLADVYVEEDITSYWKHDDREVGAWLEEAYLTDKNSVYFKCRDVLGDFRLRDYLLDLETLRVTALKK